MEFAASAQNSLKGKVFNSSMKKLLPVIIIVVVLVIALGGGALLFQSPPTPEAANKSPAAAAQIMTPVATTTPATAPGPEDKPAHVRGRAEAPVLVEEFGDFQCPPCGQFHPIMSRIEHDFPTQVRFSFRHFPIKTHHPHAVLAAHAAEAAGLQGKFWEMHDLIYDKQAEWKDLKDSRPIFMSYARSLGLDAAKFAEDIDGTRASMRLILDERRAQALGVTGTPTVFINGREIDFNKLMNYESLRGEINAELAKAGK